MKKRIPASQLSKVVKGDKKSSPKTEKKTVWDSKILLSLEGKDPNLLDKEALKIYRRICSTHAKISGPIPLPARQSTENPAGTHEDRIHRRLFQILYPTETTISLLEKLSLSEAIQASLSIEDTDYYSQ